MFAGSDGPASSVFALQGFLATFPSSGAVPPAARFGRWASWVINPKIRLENYEYINIHMYIIFYILHHIIFY